jgi:hypothetical protein
MKRKEHKDTAMNTRYPPEVVEAIRQFAQEDSRSFNGMVIWILREYIRMRKGGKDAQSVQVPFVSQ